MPDQTATAMMKLDDVAEFLDCSSRQVHKLARAGRIPKPIRITKRMVRWDREVLLQWKADGCPPVDSKETVNA